ncbi:MAG TPA: LLM class flavin-dependent oxidoreductase [Pseudonocardiaceae bacterium]|nr:LLM class flavin-dependent oxidoreductase [Pseudonocardiaceae bacterium]
MKFGVGLLNYYGCWDDAAFAEQHGFTSAGFVESPLICSDPFVAMAMTARTTSAMWIGTFLNVPQVRSTPGTAAAISTINLLAPGRVFLGTGTGNTSTVTLGMEPVKITGVRRHVNELRGLLLGEDVLHEHGGKDRHVRMTNADHVHNNAAYPIPILIAADGPLGLRMAGQIADGWITTLHHGREVRSMGNAPEVMAQMLRTVHAGAVEAGRAVDQIPTMWSTAACVLEPGESAISPRALAQVGPIAMFAFHAYAENPEIGQFLPAPVRERLETYENEVLDRLDVPRERFYQEVHTGHLSHLLDGEAAVLTEDIIKMMSLTGTAEEIAEQLQLFEAAGLTNVTLNIPPTCFRDVVLDLSTQVMPLMTA